MNHTVDSPIDRELGSLAEFVSASKAFRPQAWKRVERLKVACGVLDSVPPWRSVNAEAHRWLFERE